MFLFLSLSLAKRHTEVLHLHAHGLTQALGRAYPGDDGPLTLALGLSATMAAVGYPEASARIWVERGARLVMVARDRDRLESVATDLR